VDRPESCIVSTRVRYSRQNEATCVCGDARAPPPVSKIRSQSSAPVKTGSFQGRTHQSDAAGPAGVSLTWRSHCSSCRRNYFCLKSEMYTGTPNLGRSPVDSIRAVPVRRRFPSSHRSCNVDSDSWLPVRWGLRPAKPHENHSK
jgi:hypothetical protein